MVNTLHGGLPRPGYGPLHSSSPFHTDSLNRYAVDLERARRLLDEAGYRPDAEGVRLKVVLDYPPFHADSLGIGAIYIKSQLRKVGIAVDLRAAADFPTWAQRIASWDYRFTMNTPLDLSRSRHRGPPHLPLRQHQEDGLVQYSGLLQREGGRAASGSGSHPRRWTTQGALRRVSAHRQR